MKSFNEDYETTLQHKKIFYKIIFLILIAVSSYAMGSYLTRSDLMAGMLYSGYCPETEKIMTDVEKIHAALTQISQSRKGMLYGEKSEFVDKERILSYKNAEEILKESPDCCQVHYCSAIDCKPITDRSGAWRDIEPYRKNGLYAGHVSVKYKVNYIDKNGDKKTGEIRELNLITNCGKYFFPS